MTPSSRTRHITAPESNWLWELNLHPFSVPSSLMAWFPNQSSPPFPFQTLPQCAALLPDPPCPWTHLLCSALVPSSCAFLSHPLRLPWISKSDPFSKFGEDGLQILSGQSHVPFTVYLLPYFLCRFKWITYALCLLQGQSLALMQRGIFVSQPKLWYFDIQLFASLKRDTHWAKEMGQLVMYLLQNHENLSLDTQHLCKYPSTEPHIYKQEAEEVEAGVSLKLAGQSI